MPFAYFSRFVRGSLSFFTSTSRSAESRGIARASADEVLAHTHALDEEVGRKLQEAVNISGAATLEVLQRTQDIQQYSSRLVAYLHEAQTQSNAMQQGIDENAEIIAHLATFVEQLPLQIAEERAHFQRVVGEVRRLGEMTESIQAMSRQTEILAINAAIEAARAGEAGKGFAVLAGEVRRLATQSKESATRIENDINRLVHTVNGTGSQDFQARAAHNETESRRLAALTQKLDESYVDLRQFYKMLLSAVTTHNTQLDEQITGLLCAGQYQDVFKQIIDRSAPALAQRHEVIAALCDTLLDGSADLTEVRQRAAGLVAHYQHLEKQHEGVLNEPTGSPSGMPSIELF